MIRRHGTQPENIVAHFGPSIAPESYTMQELRDDLLRPDWQHHAYATEGGYELDVVGYARQQIINEGVSPGNISVAPVDVASDERFFSFTRHKQLGVPNGRNGFVVTMTA
jgi:copper oxidase (laccase) domain-containing protein